MDEADKVEQQISALQDPMVDISLTLHASMRRLTEAEAVKRIEDCRVRTVLRTLVHPWVVERGGGNVMTPPMVGSTWPRVRSTLELDCLPTLFQGTVSSRLVMD